MIGIVTVLYNSGPVLSDFFRTLEIQTYKDFKLYVIDNNSNDNSLELSKELSAEASFDTVILPQNENVGVAKGNNIGIKRALEDNCEYVLLANNDIVMEEDCIENLLNGMIAMNVSMAVPKIYYHDTKKMIWAAGGRFRISRCTNPHRGIRQLDKGQYDKNSLIEYSPTCFMLIRSEVFAKVGYMDENYFVYYDDADFVWRAVKEKKERLAFIASSILWHKVSFCTGGCMSDFYIHFYNRNKIYFARKHFNLIQKIVFFSYLLLQYTLRSRSIYNNEQRQLYKESCIEGWRYYNQKKHELCR